MGHLLDGTHGGGERHCEAVSLRVDRLRWDISWMELMGGRGIVKL